MASRRQALRALLARGAEPHQQLLAGQLHAGELFEPRPQPFELATPDRSLFGDPVGALREDIKLGILGQELNAHPRPGVLPRFGDQSLLQPGQPPLWGADQILHRRIGGAHLSQHRFGRHAAVHRQMRRALPYCRSMRSRKPRSVVSSLVLPGSTS